MTSPRFPQAGHSVLSLIDPSHIREAFAQPHRLTSLREAVSAAKRQMAQDDAIASVDQLALRADDHVILVRVGPRGGVKHLWDFGAV